MWPPRFLSARTFWVSLAFSIVFKMLISDDPEHQSELVNFVGSFLWAMPLCIFLNWYMRRFAPRQKK